MGECLKVDLKSKLTFVILRNSRVHVIPKANHAIVTNNKLFRYCFRPETKGGTKCCGIFALVLCIVQIQAVGSHLA